MERLVARRATEAIPPKVGYWMLAVTVTFALTVRVQVFVLELPLEHAPDHTASRPLEIRRVTDVPLANVPVPVLALRTLMPLGVDTTVSPLRPVAVTVSVTFAGGGAAGVRVTTAVTEAPL